MKSCNNLLAVGLVGVVLVAGQARAASKKQQAARSASVQADDNALESRITAKLKKNTTLAAHDVDVTVSEGIVTLTGVVRSAGEKARARQLATITGVKEVRNEI